MSKIVIKGIIKIETGLHIGGNSAYSAIGMVDSPVIKDAMTKLPIIPGSSLKGKLRALLSLEKNGKVVDVNDDGEEILRLFGSSIKNNIKLSRLQFSDCPFRKVETENINTPYEIKYENSIDRKTVKANPRQIERVVKGSEFDMLITYNIIKENEIELDLINLMLALKLLQLDYLGGGGSRGNGRVSIMNLEVFSFENDEMVLNENLTSKFKDVEDYGDKIYSKK